MDNPNPTEDLGYAYVQKKCAEARAIWRRLAEKDLCIDGLIEISRKDGSSLYLGTQVKTGKSYLRPAGKTYYRLYLNGALQRMNSYITPTIIIIYDPRIDCAYWVNVQNWVLDNPKALDTGQIDVLKENIFNRSTFIKWRMDACLVRTPKMCEEEVRSFLEINRRISFEGFIELAKHCLNGTFFGCREGIDEIEFLRDHDLLSYIESADGGPGFWKPTSTGKRYIQFILGDRYFLPFILMRPKRPICSDDITMCMDFEQYIANSRRERTKKGKNI